MIKPKVKLIDLHRLSYATSLSIQQKLFYLVKESSKNNESKEKKSYLLLVEHEPVYTIGLRRSQYLNDEFQKKIKKLKADFQMTNRGGLITFHGIGQLVAYPILNIKDFPSTKQSIKQFVCLLESSIIESCKYFSIEASRLEKLPGVWVEGQRKIAAVGLASSRYITMHGLAINCNINLEWFNHIEPCGIKDKSVTSFSQELSTNITIDQIKPVFIQKFSEQLNCSFE